MAKKKQRLSLSFFYMPILLLALLICFCPIILFAPTIYENILISYIQDKVVLVGNKNMTSHGTGFFIKGYSGITYILTNSHVCEISTDQNIYVQTTKIKPIPRRILAISDVSDLCIIEGIEGIEPLKLARYYDTFESVTSFGFPKYYGFIPSKGILTHEKITSVMGFIIENKKDRKRCNSPKNEILTIPNSDKELCIIKIKSLETTITTFGGNSGSPVVNFWGRVVGIIFAADTESNWGVIVDLKEINKFIQDY